MTEAGQFAPDWVSAPGETIADVADERGWSQSDLSLRLGYTRKHVNDLFRGRAVITPDTAQRLATVLGSTPAFWLTREAQYQAGLERQRRSEELASQSGWLAELPTRWMIQRGWVTRSAKKSQLVDQLLRWFGVASVDAWRDAYLEPLAAFRASPSISKRVGAVAAWLRAAEIKAMQTECRAFDSAGLHSEIDTLRALSAEVSPDIFVPRLRDICAAHGVAVVFVPAPPGCPVHGATRWLKSDKALLALSLRCKSNDQLWFSFFHEIGHILKHGKRLLFIEGIDGLSQDKEREADRFAADTLIPPGEVPKLRSLRSAANVCAIASSLGVAPGIVVGRMQHEGWLPHSYLNDLKVRYVWSEDQS